MSYGVILLQPTKQNAMFYLNSLNTSLLEKIGNLIPDKMD